MHRQQHRRHECAHDRLDALAIAIMIVYIGVVWRMQCIIVQIFYNSDLSAVVCVCVGGAAAVLYDDRARSLMRNALHQRAERNAIINA